MRPSKKYISFWIGVIAIFLVATGVVWGKEETVQELVSQGNTFYLKGDFKNALEAYHKALVDDLDDLAKAKIHYNLGNTRYRLGELENALKEFREALRLNPKDNDAKFNFELTLRALEGERGILKETPSEVNVPQGDPLGEEIRLILQQLEQKEFGHPKGPPTPPSPQENVKKYKKDW